MRVFEINIASEIGGREEQQDASDKWQGKETCLAVLADGVGGSAGGQAASQTVVKTAASHWQQCGGIFENPEAELTQIAQSTNDAIHALTPDEKRSPASTFVAIYLDQTHAHWVHCGDSRLYWLRRDNNDALQIKAVTRDHSVAQLLLEQNKITADEVNTHPDKGRLLKALGSKAFKGLDYASHQYEPGDLFLLCSDGYWESIPTGNPILPTKPHSITSAKFVQQLVNTAVKANGIDSSDNTTLVTINTCESSDHFNAVSDANTSLTKTRLIAIVLLIALSIILALLFQIL